MQMVIFIKSNIYRPFSWKQSLFHIVGNFIFSAARLKLIGSSVAKGKLVHDYS